MKINIKAVLCDIEGTTTSISFVKDVLFKYAFDNCEKYLLDHFYEEETEEIISNLILEAQKDNFEISKNHNTEEFIHSVALFVQKLINEDRKVKSLKLLQGKIWKFAFESKFVLGHLFDDVFKNFEKWSKDGIEIYIYSSGSVEAQKLLFKFSTSGDLTPFLKGYFDTNIGHKQEWKSYENILNHIKYDPEHVLFLSDIPNELYAAQKAGMRTLLVCRPNNYKISESEKSVFSIINSFDEIDLV